MKKEPKWVKMSWENHANPPIGKYGDWEGLWGQSFGVGPLCPSSQNPWFPKIVGDGVKNIGRNKYFTSSRITKCPNPIPDLINDHYKWQWKPHNFIQWECLFFYVPLVVWILKCSFFLHLGYLMSLDIKFRCLLMFIFSSLSL